VKFYFSWAGLDAFKSWDGDEEGWGKVPPTGFEAKD
jgi:hypothetical protein